MWVVPKTRDSSRWTQAPFGTWLESNRASHKERAMRSHGQYIITKDEVHWIRSDCCCLSASRWFWETYGYGGTSGKRRGNEGAKHIVVVIYAKDLTKLSWHVQLSINPVCFKPRRSFTPLLAGLAHDIHFKNPINSIVAMQIKTICHTMPKGSLGPPGSPKSSKRSSSNTVLTHSADLNEKAYDGWAIGAIVMAGLLST